jgi:hypothetical protein
MKKSLLLCIVILSCFYLVLSQNFIEPLSTSPAFLWANKNFFSGQNTQVIDVIPIKEIGNALTGTPSVLSQYFTKEIPEVIFVFVEPKLTTVSFVEDAASHNTQVNGGKFVNLKKLIETSSSSIVIPYVDASSVASFIPDLKNAKATVMTVEQFKNALTTMNWNNGVTDIVIIQFENADYTVHDSLLATVDKAMKSTSYVAVLTSASEPIPEANYPIYRNPNFATVRVGNTSNNNYTNGTTSDDYWPDGIVEALIIMIPFLIILFTGICCTFSVQSGLKFEGEKIKKQ